jgi:hypothetical protein
VPEVHDGAAANTQGNSGKTGGIMTMRRFLLPATATDTEARMQMTADLVRKRHRKGLETTGWVEDVYPDERGWVDQPGNSDPKRRIYYAYVATRRRRHDDY